MPRYYRRRAGFKRKRSAYALTAANQPYLEGYMKPDGSENSKAWWAPSFPAAKAAYISGQDVKPYMRRKILKYYGPGDYKSWINSIVPKGTFSWAGRQLGGMTGIPGANAVGAWAGNKLAKYVGFGDYTSGNQIVDNDIPPSQISVNRDDQSGDIYVSRTEFVQNVTCTVPSGSPASTPFVLQSFPINPGLASVFPWLSQVAQNFTLYEFNGLMFQYKPTFSEDAGPANNLGKVVMATQYDPDAGPFLNTVQMENYDYANSSKPSCGMVHGVETKNSQQFGNLQYIRTGASSRDKVFTDIGTFQLATEGIPIPTGAGAGSNFIIGELWVTYQVKLSRAELYSSLFGNNIGFDYLAGTTSASPFVNPPTVVKSTNSIGVTLKNSTATSVDLVFPPNISYGVYCAVFQVTNATTQKFTSLTGALNCTYLLPGIALPSSTAAQIFAPSSAATVSGNNSTIIVFWIQINAPGNAIAQVTINISAAVAAGTYNLWVTQQPSVPMQTLT